MLEEVLLSRNIETNTKKHFELLAMFADLKKK